MNKADRNALRATRRLRNKGGRQLRVIKHVLRSLEGQPSSLQRYKYTYLGVDWELELEPDFSQIACSGSRPMTP